MIVRKRWTAALAGMCLWGFLGCGGGGGGPEAPNTPPPDPVARTLDYRDPAGSGWRLVKNPAESTPTRLVLDLVGPSEASSYGVALNVDGERALVHFGEVRNRAYDLGEAPHFFQQAVRYSDPKVQLRFGAFHKGLQGRPTAHTGPLLSLTLNLQQAAPAGKTATLDVLRASVLTAEGLQPITVSTGTLTFQ